jgi:hypothetical protein
MGCELLCFACSCRHQQQPKKSETTINGAEHRKKIMVRLRREYLKFSTLSRSCIVSHIILPKKQQKKQSNKKQKTVFLSHKTKTKHPAIRFTIQGFKNVVYEESSTTWWMQDVQPNNRNNNKDTIGHHRFRFFVFSMHWQ